MTTAVDICNLALSEIGTRSTIDALDEGSKESIQCALWYDRMREALLRAAPWGFARAQFPLTLLGSAATTTSPYPWSFKYAYPSDALAIRYLLPPTPPLADVIPPQSSYSFCWPGPSRTSRFIIANDGAPGEHAKVILSNVETAQAVYITNEDDPDLFDPSFVLALAAALAFKLVIPLTGNVGMRTTFAQAAQDAVTSARVSDGNEAIPTTDHIPDWMAARGLGGAYANNFSLGNWFTPYQDINWGM